MTLIRPIINGELWLSALARELRLLGLTERIACHYHFVGNSRSLGSPLLPRQLELLVANLKPGVPLPVVLCRHTIIRYFLPFITPLKFLRAAECLLRGGNAEFALGIAAMEDYPARLKLCPKCAAEDWRQHGDVPFRAMHQPSGVVVCWRHGCTLKVTDVSARAGSQCAVLDAAIRGAGRAITVRHSCRRDAQWLAKASAELVGSTTPCPGPARLTTLYRERLGAIGFKSAFGRLLAAELTAAFCVRFRDLFPVIQVSPPRMTNGDNWLARMLRYPRTDVSPLKHLLMIRFLGLEMPDALLEANKLPLFQPPRRRSQNLQCI